MTDTADTTLDGNGIFDRGEHSKAFLPTRGHSESVSAVAWDTNWQIIPNLEYGQVDAGVYGRLTLVDDYGGKSVFNLDSFNGDANTALAILDTISSNISSLKEEIIRLIELTSDRKKSYTEYVQQTLNRD